MAMMTLDQPARTSPTGQTSERSAKPPRPTTRCIRCQQSITLPSAGSAWEDLPGQVRRHISGIVTTPNNATYCSACGPDLRFCHGCGCTDEAACLPHSCYWVSENECSECERKSRMPEEGIVLLEKQKGDAS